ncbi:MAG: hypothetical protein K2I96_24415 [Lachnospiraceae bacterium]|nr:hypothetical protein [Lachnospiraceae bacterium]
MIRFEWKKIFERRLNVTAMLLGYILIGVCVFVWISGASSYDGTTQICVEGIDAVLLNRQRVESQTDILSEEYLTRLIGQIQDCHLDLDSDEAYMEVIRPLGDIFWVTAKNYTDMREQIIDRNSLNEIDLTGGARFYEQRMKKITDFLNMDFSFGNYREIEKAYWIEKAEAVKTPFLWGSRDVMDMVWNLTAPGLYLIFVIVICVSSVFSSEYESGAAWLLFATKYGKNRLIWSKIVVSILFTVGYMSLGIVLGLAAIGLFLGFQGANLPVQLWDSVIPYNITAGQACAANFAVLLLVSIAIAFVLLCCSARMRSSLAALVIGVVLMIAPAFFPMSKESGLWNHINYLFPIRAIDLKTVLGSFVSYTVGNHVISYVEMIVIVYLAVSVIAVLLIRSGWCRQGRKC